MASKYTLLPIASATVSVVAVMAIQIQVAMVSSQNSDLSRAAERYGDRQVELTGQLQEISSPLSIACAAQSNGMRRSASTGYVNLATGEFVKPSGKERYSKPVACTGVKPIKFKKRKSKVVVEHAPVGARSQKEGVAWSSGTLKVETSPPGPQKATNSSRPTR